MTVISPYRTRQVRDLAWACFSPPLMHVAALGRGPGVTACALSPTAQRIAWLHDLDRDPEPLLDFLRQSADTRLGLYFERLWQFFLASDPAVELVAHNLAVHDKRRTLGEFDCLYYCRERHRHVHLELAVKFYLGHRQSTVAETSSLPNEWLGPNTADRLDRKLDQLMQRQIQLSDHPAARQTLKGLGIGGLDREVAIKGYLFQSDEDALHPPKGFNPARPLQAWTRIGNLQRRLDEQAENTFLVLPRLRWLSPAQLEQGETGLDTERLRANMLNHFQRSGTPQLVAALDQGGHETHRFFVTPNDWPALYPNPN